MQAGNPYDTIIFDFGGVLIEDPTPPMLKYLSEVFETDVHSFQAAYQKYEDPLHRGEISEGFMWACMENDLDRPDKGRANLWHDCFSDVYVPNNDLLEFIHELEDARFRIGILSNTEVALVPEIHRILKESHLGDVHGVFSCLVGHTKPGEQIYTVALEQFNTTADRTIFVDDKVANVKAAEAIGIKGILFEGIDSLQRELGWVKRK